MIRRPPRSTQGVSSAASDVYKRQCLKCALWVRLQEPWRLNLSCSCCLLLNLRIWNSNRTLGLCYYYYYVLLLRTATTYYYYYVLLRTTITTYYYVLLRSTTTSASKLITYCAADFICSSTVSFFGPQHNAFDRWSSSSSSSSSEHRMVPQITKSSVGNLQQLH